MSRGGRAQFSRRFRVRAASQSCQKMHIVIGDSNSIRELEKLCRYFNNISVRILVLSGAPFPPMVKVASDQSHFAPSGRGARWVSRSVGRGKTMVDDRSLAMSCRAAK